MKKIEAVWITVFVIIILVACSNEKDSTNSDRAIHTEESVGTDHSEVNDFGQADSNIFDKESDESTAMESYSAAESESIESKVTDPESAKEEATEAKETELESTATEDTADKTDSSVDPELKMVLDEYEAFMNEYIDFMEKYQNSDNVIDMLSDYADIMKQYVDYMSAIDKYDPNGMSAADAAYYIEVTSRVSQKLLEVKY